MYLYRICIYICSISEGSLFRTAAHVHARRRRRHCLSIRIIAFAPPPIRFYLFTFFPSFGNRTERILCPSAARLFSPRRITQPAGIDRHAYFLAPESPGSYLSLVYRTRYRSVSATRREHICVVLFFFSQKNKKANDDRAHISQRESWQFIRDDPIVVLL